MSKNIPLRKKYLRSWSKYEHCKGKKHRWGATNRLQPWGPPLDAPCRPKQPAPRQDEATTKARGCRGLTAKSRDASRQMTAPRFIFIFLATRSVILNAWYQRLNHQRLYRTYTIFNHHHLYVIMPQYMPVSSNSIRACLCLQVSPNVNKSFAKDGGDLSRSITDRQRHRAGNIPCSLQYSLLPARGYMWQN